MAQILHTEIVAGSTDKDGLTMSPSDFKRLPVGAEIDPADYSGDAESIVKIDNGFAAYLGNGIYELRFVNPNSPGKWDVVILTAKSVRALCKLR